MDRNSIRYLVAGMFAVLFLALAALVGAGLTAPFDTAVRAAVHYHASIDLTQIALLFSFIGSAWVWVSATVVVIVVLWIMSRCQSAIAMTVCMLGAVLLDNGLKFLFHRARPLGFFAADPRSYGFPSGHALFAACLYGALATVLTAELRSAPARGVLWTAAIVAVLCIGWSRIYLGVHYPSDVLAGYLVGAAWVQTLRAAGWFPDTGGAEHRRVIL